MIIFHTTMGDISIELDAENAPNTAANFEQYVKDGFYDGTIFHRVIKKFMVQGGGMEPGMKEKTTRPPIQNEAQNGLANDKYTLAMARTGEPHSATAQFFINSKDNDFLNFRSDSPDGWGYCVFGKVVDGTDVVDAIEQVETDNYMGHGDVPLEDIIVESTEIV
jgi:peptidyl-prolyl cis-trans isomerase B (cyclophilin B)